MRIRPKEEIPAEQAQAPVPGQEEQEEEAPEEKVAYVEREINLSLINNKLNYNNALLEKICSKLGISLKE